LTIEKAIEILSILESRSINHSRMFKKDALKLGLEALKAVKEQYDPYYQMFRPPLPGETLDD